MQEEGDGRGLDGNASLLLGEKGVGKAEIFVEVAVLVFDVGMSLLDQAIHQIRLSVMQMPGDGHVSVGERMPQNRC